VASDFYRDDGRRSKPECSECGEEDLEAAIDPTDDTIMLGCPRCREVVAVGDIRFADVSLTFSFEEVDDVDPRLRGPIQEAMDDVE